MASKTKYIVQKDTGLQPTYIHGSTLDGADYLRNSTGNTIGFPPNYFYNSSPTKTLISNIEDPKMKIYVPRKTEPSPILYQILKPSQDLWNSPSAVPSKNFVEGMQKPDFGNTPVYLEQKKRNQMMMMMGAGAMISGLLWMFL
jgi:hypothetical protein